MDLSEFARARNTTNQTDKFEIRMLCAMAKAIELTRTELARKVAGVGDR